jgi:hypothetical protein
MRFRAFVDTLSRGVPNSVTGSVRTFSEVAEFGDKRLYAGPSVHYRDETDISGFVAQGGRSITDQPHDGSAGTQSAMAIESR